MICMWGDDTWELHMKDLISHTVWSRVIQRCERRFGGERGRGRVTQREREKERIDYADHIMQTCIYRWSGVCIFIAIQKHYTPYALGIKVCKLCTIVTCTMPTSWAISH